MLLNPCCRQRFLRHGLGGAAILVVLALPIFGMRMPITGALVIAVVSYLLSLAGVFLLGLIINALAPSFGSVANARAMPMRWR